MNPNGSKGSLLRFEAGHLSMPSADPAIEPAQRTIWDIASAPFFGVKLSADAKTKSCTARSMAFRKDLWQRVGGFPSTCFSGRYRLRPEKCGPWFAPTFAERAKAFYRPEQFSSAVQQLARYSLSDGVAGASRAPDA